MNLVSVLQCTNCSMPFSNLPKSAFVVSDARTSYESGVGAYEPPFAGGGPSNLHAQHRTTGENTFFWYRMYCGSLALFNALFAVLWILLLYVQPDAQDYSQEDTIVGIIYALFFTVFFVVFIVATLLPVKPYNWVVGIVMIGIGMTSCCLWPAVIPLLIYWIKPETRSFFGRS